MAEGDKVEVTPIDAPVDSDLLDSVMPYIRIARPDHWLKNVFMIPGILLAFFFEPALLRPDVIWGIVFGLIAACFIASSNYVLNEILDAKYDRVHPEKHARPLASGDANRTVAWILWLALGALGIGIALLISPLFALSGAMLWVMGLLYNIPPIRLKDWPYADVLSESINNPIRLAMGWYCTGLGLMPPLSMFIAYWMFGGFLMAAKRFAEFRSIGNAGRAAQYRKSFAWYTEERLLVSLFFYATLFALMAGYFIARYRFELILAAPLVAVTMAYYMHMAHKPDSAAQYPEKLHQQKKLVWLLTAVFIACAALLFVDFPDFRSWFAPWITPAR